MRIHPRSVLKLAALCAPLLALHAAADLRAAEPAARREQPPEFSIVVSTPGDGVVATCDEACAWKRVSARYPEGAYRITRIGIELPDAAAGSSADSAPPSGFSIVVTATDGGIIAACDRGCAWKTASARYPGGTYRITDKGIVPAGEAAHR